MCFYCSYFKATNLIIVIHYFFFAKCFQRTCSVIIIDKFTLRFMFSIQALKRTFERSWSFSLTCDTAGLCVACTPKPFPKSSPQKLNIWCPYMQYHFRQFSSDRILLITAKIIKDAFETCLATLSLKLVSAHNFPAVWYIILHTAVLHSTCFKRVPSRDKLQLSFRNCIV